MNEQTKVLVDEFARQLASIDDWGWDTCKENIKATYLRKARIFVLVCKVSGLLWYDGKRAQFREIEL